MRAVLAQQAERCAARESEPERLLEEAGFGIARRSYTPREVLQKEGIPRAALCVLTSGLAFLLTARPTRREVALGLLRDWDAFGNLAFAPENPPRAVLVRALTACEVAKVPARTLEAAVRRNPLVTMKLMTLQDARLTGHEDFVARVWPRKTPVRLAGTLLFLAERFPRGARPHPGRSLSGLASPWRIWRRWSCPAGSRWAPRWASSTRHRWRVPSGRPPPNHDNGAVQDPQRFAGFVPRGGAVLAGKVYTGPAGRGTRGRKGRTLSR